MPHRDKFFVPEGIYALSHSVGPLTLLGQDLLDEKYLEPLKQSGGDAWPDWLSFMDEFTSALASFLGGHSDHYCPQVNLSSGVTKFLTALPAPESKTDILMHAHAFPTMGFVAKALVVRGYSLRLIDENFSATDPQVWQDHINDKTAAILITHVYSNTGALSSVAELARLARDQGVLSLVDIAQSAGVIPIDIPSWNADAVFGSSVKWLCGGPGAGYMWVNPNILPDLLPEDVGWFSHADPFEFDIRDFRYAKSAKKFLGGTPSVAPYAMALGGVKTLTGIGIETIRTHNVKLMTIVDPDIDGAKNGGTLAIDFGERINHVSAALRAAGCKFDQRGTRLRLSFHVFNTEDEAVQVAEISSKLR